MQIRRTHLKKLHRFHFLLFSRTTSKKPSRFTQNFWSQSRRLFVDRDEGRIFTFSIKIHRFSLFWHVYGIFAQKFHPVFINFHPKWHFHDFFTKPYWKAFEIDTRRDKNFTFWDPKSHVFIFSDVSDVSAPKLHHKFMIWCPTIPFWTPKWSQTSSASWPSLAGPGWPARPPGPAGGGQAGGPVGCFLGRERGKSSGGARSAQQLMEPPHSYHRRWVI